MFTHLRESLEPRSILGMVFLLFCLVAVNAFFSGGLEKDFSILSEVKHLNTSFSLAWGLGEFLSLFVDYLLLGADYYWDTGRWYYLPLLYETILRMQPEYLETWSLLGWFYAFNVSALVQGETDGEMAIQKGIRTLRAGLRYHPRRWELYFDLAWVYFYKEKDYAKAYFYIQRAVGFSHPMSVDRLAALCLFRLGRGEEAAEVWQVYLQKNPEDALAREELKRVEALLQNAEGSHEA